MKMQQEKAFHDLKVNIPNDKTWKVFFRPRSSHFLPFFILKIIQLRHHLLLPHCAFSFSLCVVYDDKVFIDFSFPFSFSSRKEKCHRQLTCQKQKEERIFIASERAREKISFNLFFFSEKCDTLLLLF